MTLTAAMQEAYALRPRGEIIIDTLEFDHVTFAAPLRIAANVETDISLPLTFGGGATVFKAVPVSVTLPGVSSDGKPNGLRIVMDNVAMTMLPYLRDAIQSSSPITVKYRGYTTKDLTQPGDVIDGLELRAASMTAASVEATVGFKEIELQAFPLETYNEELYPALQGNG